MVKSYALLVGLSLAFCIHAKSLLGEDDCTEGPSFWCASSENAELCGMNPQDCTNYCANLAEYPSLQNSDMCMPEPIASEVPADQCAEGPSYWCATAANTEECGMAQADCTEHCAGLEVQGALDNELCSASAIRSNNCTWGPAYWCASSANAAACNLTEVDCAEYCAEQSNSTNPQFNVSASDMCDTDLGEMKCTWGPSYWCASKANAKICGLTADGCRKYCENPLVYPELVDSDICNSVLGSDNCTWGPSFWCASKANAEECDLAVEECKRYCGSEDYASLADSEVCADLLG